MHRTHRMVFLCNRLPISHGQLLQIGDKISAKISAKIRDGPHRIRADLGADIHRGLLDTGANGVHHFLPGQLDLPVFQEVTNDAGHDHKDAFGIIVGTLPAKGGRFPTPPWRRKRPHTPLHRR